MSAREVTKRRKMKPWGEAHQRETARRLYEIAAEYAGRGDDLRALEIASEITDDLSEAAFRESLFDPPGPDMGMVQIEREVRRIRALAEGRLVRSEERVVLWPDGIKRPLVTDTAVPKGWPILRVTRIKRAP